MEDGGSLRINHRIAAARMRLAILSALSASIKAGFRRDQPRDSNNGRWNGGGGQVAVLRHDNKTGDPKIDARTDLLIDVVKEVVERVGPGSGPAYGLLIHSEVARAVRSLDLPGIGRHGVEQSFSGGDLVRYGLSGSVRTDIIMRDGRTEAAPIRAIWDIKTGTANISTSRAREIREALGVDESMPVIELHIINGISIKSYLNLSRAHGKIASWRRDHDDGCLHAL